MPVDLISEHTSTNESDYNYGICACVYVAENRLSTR